MIRNW